MATDRLEFRLCMRVQGAFAAALIAGVVLAGFAGSAAAQSSATGARAKPPAAAQPVRRGKTYKQPLVDLEKQAQLRRPGQVLPGDPPPEKFAEPIAEPKPALPLTPPTPVAAPAPEGVRDTGTGRPLKSAPTPVDPASGPRPLPKGGDGGAESSAPPSLPSSLPPADPVSAPPLPPPASSPAPAASAEPLDTRVTPIPGSAAASADDRAPPSEPARSLKAAVVPIDPAIGPRPSTDPSAISVANTPVSASVRVVRASASDAQWRPVGGAWQVLAAGEPEMGRFEIRTGMDGEAVVDIDGLIEVRVLHLSRVTVERWSGESAAPAVLIERGAVELRAKSSEPVETWVRTPDRSAGFSTLPGVRVVYNAFSGTAVQSPAIAHP